MFGLIVSGLLGVAFAGFYIFMFAYDAFNAQTWWAHPVCIGGFLICAVIFCVILEHEYFVFTDLADKKEKTRSAVCREIKYRAPYKLKGVNEKYNTYEWARFLMKNRKQGGISLMESLAKNDFTPAQAFYGYAILQGEYGFKKDEKLGLKWLRLAEEQECPVAYTYLYYAYKDGTGVKANEKKAEKYLEMALAKSGFIPEALLAKGYEYFHNGDEEKAKAYFTKANEINKNYGKEELCDIIMSKELLPMEAEMVLSMLKKAVTTNKVLRLTAYAYEWGDNIQKSSRYFLAAAHQGDKSSKKILADYYMYGLLPTDYKKAEEYLLPLANEGDAQAYIKLGRLYSTFKDFYDEEKAEKYLVLAAESGEAEYMYSLGSFYERIKYDYKKAKSNYKQAAELGYAKAQSKYGERLWLDGKDKQALEWIEKGAAQGDKDALFMLGKFHDEHNNEKKAFEAYMQAAEKGCEISQYRVGDAYLRGKGVAQNDKKGVAWILKAGENGHFEAYAMLSVLYEQGVGVPKDLVKAEYWKAKLDEFLSNT